MYARLDAIAQSSPDDPGEDEFFLWPECVGIFEAWLASQTQWRTGAAGATGLDYTGVATVLDEFGFARSSPERREAFDSLRACELETLSIWSERREREESARRPPGSV